MDSVFTASFSPASALLSRPALAHDNTFSFSYLCLCPIRGRRLKNTPLFSDDQYLKIPRLKGVTASDLSMRASELSEVSLQGNYKDTLARRSSIRFWDSGLSCSHGEDLNLPRRGLLKGIGAAGISMCASVITEPSVQGMEKLPFKPEGYNFWTWRNHKIHYVVQGEGRPIVLIHGFGASAFHWRYNIPKLAKEFKVYAIDLLGFGWSEKAIIDYNANVWRDQVADFLNEIVKDPAILVGNSLGGLTALITAADCPESVSGVAILNSAGQFRNPEEQSKNAVEETAIQRIIINPLKNLVQRAVLTFAFWQAKQPSRVQSVLKSVYPNSTNVDDYLIESIIRPTGDPNAGEVYYRLITQFMFSPSKVTLNDILEKLSCPLLLLWGDLDPWVGPSKAEKIKEIYPNSSLVHLQAGHCPHDEVPDLVNEALLNWALPLSSPISSQAI